MEPGRHLLEQCCQKLSFSNKFALLNPGGVGQKERTWLGHVLSAVNELASFDLEGDDPIAHCDVSGTRRGRPSSTSACSVSGELVVRYAAAEAPSILSSIVYLHYIL